MKNLSIYILLLLTFVLCQKANAQDYVTKKDTSVKFRYGLGFGGGSTTGYGLSFKYFPSSYTGKLGAQVNFAPYQSVSSKQYSFGLTFLYKLVENQKSSLYLYQGNSLLYRYDNYKYYYYGSNTTSESLKINNGIGIGIEIIILQRVGFNIMAGYGGYDSFKTITIAGEGGLYYKF